MMVLAILFWVSVALVVYSYVVYPIVLHLLPGRSAQRQGEHPFMPSVSVVIAAFNEEADIRDRVDNLLAIDYPTERIRFLIGSDGSTDGTNDILREFEDHPRMDIFLFEENRGKANVLNDLIAKAKGEIVVLSDANTTFESDSVAKLVAAFEDEEVGCVCGSLKLQAEAHATNEDSLYWRYETAIKQGEGAIGSLIGANGANYAIRQALFTPLPSNTVVDDFVIALRILAAGHRVVFVSESIAYEVTPDHAQEEYNRRVRIGSGNFVALSQFWRSIVRRGGAPLFCFVSHKLLRWLGPLWLSLALLTSGALAIADTHLVYQLAFGAQLLGYTLAYLVWKTPKVRWPRVFGVWNLFVAMNVALGHGFFRFALGRSKPVWSRSERSPQRG